MQRTASENPGGAKKQKKGDSGCDHVGPGPADPDRNPKIDKRKKNIRNVLPGIVGYRPNGQNQAFGRTFPGYFDFVGIGCG
jgi:hypothetical protein